MASKITHHCYTLSTATDRKTLKVEVRHADGRFIGQYASWSQAWAIVRDAKGKMLKFDGPYDPIAASASSAVKQKFSVQRRFSFMERMIEMIAKDVAAGAVICGPAGIGKTHTVTAVLNRCGLKEDDGYVMVKGTVSPLGLYRTLYHNSDRLIVFDDCDSALFDYGCFNLLKAALDTCDRRVLTWCSKTTMSSTGDLPERFEFTGRILFISNLSEDRVDQAIVSRTMMLDLKMSRDEIMDRLEMLSPVICQALSPEELTEVICFLKDNIDNIADLNLRTLIKLGNVRQTAGADWEDMAHYIFTR